MPANQWPITLTRESYRLPPLERTSSIPSVAHFDRTSVPISCVHVFVSCQPYRSTPEARSHSQVRKLRQPEIPNSCMIAQPLIITCTCPAKKIDHFRANIYAYWLRSPPDLQRFCTLTLAAAPECPGCQSLRISYSTSRLTKKRNQKVVWTVSSDISNCCVSLGERHTNPSANSVQIILLPGTLRYGWYVPPSYGNDKDCSENSPCLRTKFVESMQQRPDTANPYELST